MTIAPGTYVGPYEILAPLGAGGMGEVYRARDPKLGRELAIKILPAHFGSDSEQMHRFEREARSASMLSHPSVVTIYEVGHFQARPFIAMELIEGVTLRSVLARSAIPVKRALLIAERVAEGLAAAHERGIVHRDLKPDNLMIGKDGSVKILDFGLAKLMDLETSEKEVTARFARNQTTPGTILGTVGYMSPEQAGGDPVDFRSDQFSFGTILFEMLTGARPFERGTSVETLSAIIRDEAPPITQLNPKVPEQLGWIVDRLLNKSPNERYASTRDLVHDLERVVESASDSGSSKSPARPTRQRMLVAIALLLPLLGGLFWFGMRDRSERFRGSLPQNKYLAVLPFENLTSDTRDDLLSHGVSEVVSARLGRVRGINVMPPSASGGYVQGNRPLKQIAQELGANLLLDGSVRREGSKIRITYTLLDRNGILLASDTVRGSADDIFKLEDELAESVAQTLQLQIGSAIATSTGLDDAGQQDTYLRALGLLQRYADDRSIDQAIRLLEELAGKADGSHLVHAALGRAYLYKYELTHDPSFAERAISSCERAVKLDPQSPEVHLTLGELRLATGRFSDAISEFKLSLASQPNLAEAALGLAEAYGASGSFNDAKLWIERGISMRPQWWSGYNDLGVLYSRHGKLAEAASMFQKAIDLAPDNWRPYDNLGAVYFQTGRFQDALATISKSLSLRPNDQGYSNQGYCFYLLGRYDEAVAAHKKAIALTPRDYLLWINLGDAYRWSPGKRQQAEGAYGQAISLAEERLRLNPNDGMARAMVALASAKIGKMDVARTQIASALQIDSGNLEILNAAATIAVLNDRTEDAFDLLEKAAEKGYSSSTMRLDPELAAIRSHPRFQRLLQKEKAKIGESV